MTSPIGLPLMPNDGPGRYLRRFQALGQDPALPSDLQLQRDPEDVAFDALVPSRSRGRVLTLDELSDARVVANEKPGFRQRLGAALEGAAGTLDPNADSGIEAGLGAGLNTFARIRGLRRNQQAGDDEMDAAIVRAAQDQQAESRATQLREALTVAQIDATDALTASRLGLTPDANGVPQLSAEDVGPLAEHLEATGRPDLAQLILRAPNLVARAPASFVRFREDDADPEEPTGTDRRRVTRADDADQFAARELEDLLKPNALGITAAQPAQADSVLGVLRRRFDPTYAADSTLRAGLERSAPAVAPPPNTGTGPTDFGDALAAYRHRIGGGTQRTVAPSGPRRTVRDVIRGGSATRTPAPRLAPDLEAVAAGINPTTVPMAQALEVLRDSAVQPALTPEELRAVLLTAGYQAADIERALNDRPRSRPRR